MQWTLNTFAIPLLPFEVVLQSQRRWAHARQQRIAGGRLSRVKRKDCASVTGL